VVTARSLRASVIGLNTTCSLLATTLERLCDRDLGGAEREASTNQLHTAISDMREALVDIADAVLGPEEEDNSDSVVNVSRSRWRRHRWGQQR
jgi:hypothetical protein